MFEHQTAQILSLDSELIRKLLTCLVYSIQNPLHEVQEAGFRAILSLAIYLRAHSTVAPLIREMLESLLADSIACLFIGGVGSDNVSNACAAIHGLAIILPVCPQEAA
jgi:hypothetical protein